MHLSFDTFVHDVYILPSGAWLLIALMFALGAALGSFFNVVAYRLPRGMSLNRPGSRCPSCGHAIRWHDNVPIFGWLALGGRCRDCGAAISPRYPLVELLAALATALVSWSALVPTVMPDVGDAYSLYVSDLGARLAVVWTLFCAALLEFDGHRPPARLLLVVLVLGTAAALVFGRGVDEIVRSLAAALLLGLLAWPLLVRSRPYEPLRTGAARVVELAIVGVLLGLPAVALIAALAAFLSLVASVLGRAWKPAARSGWAGSLLGGTLIWIAAGPAIAALWPSLGRDDLGTLVAAGTLVAVLAIAARIAGQGAVTIQTGGHV